MNYKADEYQHKTLVYTLPDLISGDLSICWQMLVAGVKGGGILAGNYYYSWAAVKSVFPLDVWRPLRSKNAL